MTNTDYDSLFNFLGYKTKSAEQESNSKTEFYFRGHSDSSYLLAPAIFREDKLTEDDVYHEIFRNHADEFRGMKPIDVLAKMQHYGVPTRLLDVTANPLVAAFFSISNLSKENPKGKSPEVLAFVVEKENIKNYDSDTVKLLSHLPLLKKEEREQLRIDALNSILIHAIVGYINKYLTQGSHYLNCDEKKEIYLALLKYVSEYIYIYEEDLQGKGKIFFNDKDTNRGFIIKSNYNKSQGKKCQIISKKHDTITISCEKGVLNIEELLTQIYGQGNEPLIDFLSEYFYIESEQPIITENTELNDFRELSQLYFQIKQNYPVFYKCARPLDLLNGVFVTPIVNSDRMRAQQGAFMLFGLSRYWDVWKCMQFLDKEKFTYEDIMQFIIDDKRLDDTPLADKTNLFYQHYKNLPENKDMSDKDFYNKVYMEKVREFEDYIFGITRYSLDETKKVDVLRKLDAMGINKQTLGCGMDTTYYNMLCKKE